VCPKSDLCAVNKGIFLVRDCSVPYFGFLHPAVWSVLRALIYRHETYAYHTLHNRLRNRAGSVSGLQIVYTPFAGFSSQRRRFTTISVHVELVVGSGSLELPASPSNSV
jgi:hypothetical protein